MKPLLLLLVCLLHSLLSFAQDSSYYSVLWKETGEYKKAGVTQEGVFYYVYKDGSVRDSVLVQTFFYNNLGQLTRRQDYRANKLRTRFTYYYSGSRLDSTIQEEIFWLPARLVYKYSYDAAGNLLLEESFNRGVKTQHLRYTYNNRRQPLEQYTQIGGLPEFLSARYTYRPDHLIQQIDVFFDKGQSGNNFSFFYTYANQARTVTRSFQRASSDKRYIDWIKTYNEKAQLIEKISPPLKRNSGLQINFHGRQEEETETSVYDSNGLVRERQIRRNEKISLVERHFYF